jgi:hypothetical protein
VNQPLSTAGAAGLRGSFACRFGLPVRLPGRFRPLASPVICRDPYCDFVKDSSGWRGAAASRAPVPYQQEKQRN